MYVSSTHLVYLSKMMYNINIQKSRSSANSASGAMAIYGCVQSNMVIWLVISPLFETKPYVSLLTVYADGGIQEPDRLGTTKHRFCEAHTGPHSRYRSSFRWFSIFQHGQLSAYTWPLDADVRYTESIFDSYGIYTVYRRSGPNRSTRF